MKEDQEQEGQVPAAQALQVALIRQVAQTLRAVLVLRAVQIQIIVQASATVKRKAF